MSVERANGVLKRRFATLSKPAEWWDDHLRYAEIFACLCLHNLCRLHAEEDFEDAPNNADDKDKDDRARPPR